MDPMGQGWSEDRKQQWRIACLLEQQIQLLQKILARLPQPLYAPTAAVVVTPVK